ncbi:hypothetical protein [Pseudomonas sp. SO81]|uniref:substrate-binding periplasmic protein n=1 Tax=Pseudomonas sp. SO81 TaxID=2983246 RepID=UPI0025A32F0A|nr:hypothetical protein [Pseudomonas sp. SO81]WJN57731.1 hypothetical protein OH686_03210 [Pseudomonas sp. SO81]
MPGRRLWVLPLLSGLLVSAVHAEDWPQLRLCYESQDLSPYTSAPPGLAAEHPGLVMELIEQAARTAQLQLVLHRQPWKRCVHEVRQGASDGVFVAVWWADRDAWGRFPGRSVDSQTPVDPSRSLWPADYRIIVRPDSALQWDGQRFQGITHGVGAPLGYAVSQYLQSLGVLANESLTPATALRLVAAGRLDGYVLETELGLALIKREGLQGQLVQLPTPLVQAHWYLPLSHQFYAAHPERAERLWQAIGEQRQQREAELRQRYLSR